MAHENFIDNMRQIDAQKIIEDAKLIIEFMGFIPISENDFLGYNYPYKEGSVKFNKLMIYDKAKYISSFDCLIPVARKCCGIAEDTMMDEWVGSIYDAAGAFNLETLYKEVVEFIKFYNNNNPNEFNI